MEKNGIMAADQNATIVSDPKEGITILVMTGMFVRVLEHAFPRSPTFSVKYKTNFKKNLLLVFSMHSLTES